MNRLAVITGKASPEAEAFTITFRAVRGSWPTAPIQRLRGLLKVALRGFGFWCEDIETETSARERAEREGGEQ